MPSGKFDVFEPYKIPRPNVYDVIPDSQNNAYFLVLGAEEEIRFVVIDERRAVLTLDGRVLGTLEPGDAVTCTGGPRPARIVTFTPRDFHQILKAKFGLADR